MTDDYSGTAIHSYSTDSVHHTEISWCITKWRQIAEEKSTL